MEYYPLELDVKEWSGERGKAHYEQAGSFLERCPSIEYYLKPLLPGPVLNGWTGDSAWWGITQERVNAQIEKWEVSAPRRLQRMQALSFCDDNDHWIQNLLLHGRETGTGKTTVAYEWLWRLYVGDVLMMKDQEILPLALSGHQFARRVAANAKDLDAFMSELISAPILLLDDLDKRGDGDGKFSPIVQQALLACIEERTTGDDMLRTAITLNSNGEALQSKFHDDVGPYILRRLRERFYCVDFDPVMPVPT